MSSHVFVSTDGVSAAAGDLRRLGEALRVATGAAGPATVGIVPLAGDEVSAAVARLFGAYGQEYQALSVQVGLFHDRFVQALSAGAGAYAGAEVAGASPLQFVEQGVLGLINAPTNTLWGRPLIGDGVNGAAGTGQAGGDGGILW
ncbi:PE family protein, partial [Mycobacterium asiaticum]|uniref:PE family protein n=1 Tax=Mycobacterium asiaticum TaxID=1790 RepID=UPI000AF77394